MKIADALADCDGVQLADLARRPAHLRRRLHLDITQLESLKLSFIRILCSRLAAQDNKFSNGLRECRNL